MHTHVVHGLELSVMTHTRTHDRARSVVELGSWVGSLVFLLFYFFALHTHIPLCIRYGHETSIGGNGTAEFGIIRGKNSFDELN